MKNDDLNGQGYYIFSGGDRYKGSLRNGVKEG